MMMKANMKANTLSLPVRARRGSGGGLDRQRGVMLLEALIAILIFSIGILAIVGMQSSAVKASSDAKYRSDAALLANELLGQMWVSNHSVASLQANFNSPSGANFVAWQSNVQATLPGVTSTSNQPTVLVDGTGTVTVQLSWKLPSDPSTAPSHSHVVVAQIF